jgi:hypothetical protein
MAKSLPFGGRPRSSPRLGMIWGGVGAKEEDLVGTLRIAWRKICRLALDNRKRLYFDWYVDCPGVYRISVVCCDGSKHEYIGESINLKRRFADYRHPKTPHARRISNALRQFLLGGATIDVEKVEQASIDLKGLDDELNIFSSDHRKCIEYFVLTATSAKDVRRLNR